MVEGRLLFVGYTIRDGRIRIITARKAEPYEAENRPENGTVLGTRTVETHLPNRVKPLARHHG